MRAKNIILGTIAANICAVSVTYLFCPITIGAECDAFNALIDEAVKIAACCRILRQKNRPEAVLILQS
jgi:hypothetical protein